MKKIRLLILILAATTISTPLLAYEEAFVTGKDWVESMSREEKYISLVPPTLLLNEYDIHPRLSLPNYVQLIDKQLELNPRLASEDISNIYTATVYAVEPELRNALRGLETRFLRGDLNHETVDTPHLTIHSSLET